MGRLSRPEFDKLKWPTNYREPLCYRASFATGHSDNGIVQNMDWTGLDWTGLDSWTGQLDWTVGLDSSVRTHWSKGRTLLVGSWHLVVVVVAQSLRSITTQGIWNENQRNGLKMETQESIDS